MRIKESCLTYEFRSFRYGSVHAVPEKAREKWRERERERERLHYTASHYNSNDTLQHR